MKRVVLLFLLSIFIFSISDELKGQNEKSPKLVVGIVIDQMRYDYLYRYWDQYSENGFKRLINQGFSCENQHFSYMPTYTGPGHASIYTGTTPSMHGIIANDWWDKYKKEYVYCAQDLSVTPVGSEHKMEKRSPKNLMVTTLGDQVKLGTNYKGKVIGISIKDRGAIFPAGKMGDQAWWFTGEDGGKFITSSYYTEELPDWVSDFNKKNNIKSWLKEGWKPLLPEDQYTQSNKDDSPYEGDLWGKVDPVFPYNLWKLSEKGKDANILKVTPYGNTVITDFAILAIDENEIGMDQHTDMLAISYSSPDYIGHNFGTRAIETQDTYLRLDLEIARLLETLDKKVGKGNYLLFLTADHGAAVVPQELIDNRVNINYFARKGFALFIKEASKTEFKTDTMIEKISNYQIFLNPDAVSKSKIDREDIQAFIAAKALEFDGVYRTTTASILSDGQFDGFLSILQKGYNQKYSGDILYVLNPGWLNYNGTRTGTTHGSAYAYDTHVPFILYGWGIKHGSTSRRTLVEDITPTITGLIHMQMPMGCTGNPVVEVVD
jgi:predicted AlkP superfamily pyrophosphatase or phosphodiesterase